jgi:hypothetical protein
MSSLTLIKKVYLAHLIHKRRKKRTRTEYVRDLFVNKEQFGGQKLVNDLKNDPWYHYHHLLLMIKKNVLTNNKF